MGTSYNLIYVTDKEIDFQAEIDSIFDVMNLSLSTYIPISDISKVNDGDTTLVIDKMFQEVFQLSKEITRQTNGYFDPTVGTLVNAWGFGPGKQIQLDSVKVDSLLQYVGFNKVELTSENTIRKNKNIKFDFNAIAKGYAIDRLAVMLDKKGIENYLLEVGGEVVAKGKNKLKRKQWTAGVNDPTIEDRNAYRAAVYLKDVAKVTLSPVLHVNADDAEAVCHAMEMAVEYRTKFKKDIYIDLLGYRKYGHNEGDEPRFTQPKLYKAIAKHKNAKEIYADKLIAEGSISSEYVAEITKEFKDHLEAEFTESKKKTTSKIQEFMPEVWDGFVRKQLKDMLQPVDTSYSVEGLKGIAKVISTTPDGHKFVRKAERILKGRDKMVFEENSLDWGTAENLAYGTLLEEGFNVRIIGEDVERETF